MKNKIKEIEYEISKIKRKLDMFLKTNNIEYLNKANYLINEIINKRV